MKKLAVIVLFLLILLGIVIVAYVSKYGEPPELQAKVYENTYIAQKGTYSWSNMFEKTQADSATPTQMEYNEQNIIDLNVGDTIKITTDNHLEFYVKKLNYIDQQEQDNILLVNESLVEEKSKEAILETPTIPGTYILEIIANFYKYGEVTYCFKVNVTPNISSYEIYNETNLILADKVNEIVQKLPYSQYKETIEIEENKLSIIYKSKELKKEDLEFNSIMLLGLIPNLSNIKYQIKNNEEITEIEIDRNMYQEDVNYEYLGLVRYVMLKGRNEDILNAWENYIPYLTIANTKNDEISEEDAKMLALLAIYGANQKESLNYENGYPYELINKLNKEVYEISTDLPKENIGSFVYNAEKNVFEFGTDYQTPYLLRPYNIIQNEKQITIEYQYCYPKDSDVFNLKMDKVEGEENTFTVNKDAYNRYIFGLQKYSAKIVIEKNEEYEYSKYKVVSFENITK